MPQPTGTVLGFTQSIYMQVFAKSVASIVVDRASFYGSTQPTYKGYLVFGFLTILFETSQPEDRSSIDRDASTYSEMSGFGDPSYRRTK